MLSSKLVSPEYLSAAAFSPAYSINEPKKASPYDVLELVTDGYWLLDKGYRIVHASNKAELWIGVAAAELAGESCWSFLPKEVGRALLIQQDGYVHTAAETRWLHSSFQTCLKLRLTRRAEGWLLSFHEESTAWLPALQAVIGAEQEARSVQRFSPPRYVDERQVDRLVSAQQQVLSAAESERCRIARELHDVLGQYVTALRFGLDNLAHELEYAQAETSSVMKLQSMVEQFDQEFHHVALKLRPPMTERGLKAAMVQYALEWSERSSVRLDFHSSEDQWVGLSPETETSLYRVLQEALNNVQKYAGARRASVILERRHGQLQMVIEDDGCGFDVAQALESGRKIGLASMSERAVLAGGVCEIESSIGQGTTIFIRVPLTQEEVMD